jgi:hypothetical protein
MEGHKPMCEWDGGGGLVRKFYWAENFLTALPTNPPITLTHSFKPLQPSTPPPLLFSPSDSALSLLHLRLPTFPLLPIWAPQSNKGILVFIKPPMHQ